MPLKREVHRNLEKGREWAAGGVGGNTVCVSVSLDPTPLPLLHQANAILFLLSAPYSRAGVCQHWGLALQLHQTRCRILSKPFPLQTLFPIWTVKVYNQVISKFNYFPKVTGLSLIPLGDDQKTSPLLAKWCWASHLTPLKDHPNESQFSLFYLWWRKKLLLYTQGMEIVTNP